LTRADGSNLAGARVVVINWRDPWHHLAGGSERYAWEFATAMREAGAQVEFVTARDSHQVTRETREGIRVRRGGGAYGFYPFVLALLVVRRLRRRGPHVVVDAENGIPVFSPLVLGRSARIVLVMHHVHQEQFRTYFRRPLSDLGRFLERRAMPWVYRRVRILSVSGSTVEEMTHQLGWTPAVEVVPNGADAPTVELPPGRTSQPDRLVVLGRLATHKRVDAVIRAVCELRRERPALHLDVVGAGPELEALVDLIDAVGARDHVTLHGFLPAEEKARLLAEARLHLCASDAEGWGQVVVEAATYGLPTLARDVPGLRESIRDGETGWLVPETGPGPVEDRLVAGIRAALLELDDEARRDELATACRAWAARFTWEGMRRRVREIAEQELRRPS
jgi:glycosyltransferase involved in cell wall biosynthesis